MCGAECCARPFICVHNVHWRALLFHSVYSSIFFSLHLRIVVFLLLLLLMMMIVGIAHIISQFRNIRLSGYQKHIQPFRCGISSSNTTASQVHFHSLASAPPFVNIFSLAPKWILFFEPFFPLPLISANECTEPQTKRAHIQEGRMHANVNAKLKMYIMQFYSLFHVNYFINASSYCLFVWFSFSFVFAIVSFRFFCVCGSFVCFVSFRMVVALALCPSTRT